MKQKILTAFLLLLALAVGLLLPQIAMITTDRSLYGQTETVDMEEVSLLFTQDESGQGLYLIDKITAFQNGDPSIVLIGTDTAEDYDNAIAIATEALNTMMGNPPAYTNASANYELAYFSEDLAFPVWDVWLIFGDSGTANMILDDATGAILSMYIWDGGPSLDVLFSRYRQDAEAMGIDFEQRLSMHIAAVLSGLLGDSEPVSLEYNYESRRMSLFWEIGEVEVPYVISEHYGIILFNPTEQQLLAAENNAAGIDAQEAADASE